MTIGQGRQKNVDDLDIRYRTYNDRSRSTKKILDDLDTTYK